jgi:hypothetical protein
MATTAAEQSKTRSDLAQLAGAGPVSLMSILGGVLVGYAAFALMLGGAIAVLTRRGSELDLTEGWDNLSTRGGVLLGILLFASYLLAGYMAGRMAWRRGLLHGIGVFVGSVVVVGAVALLVRSLAKPDDVEAVSEALRGFGIPITREEWGNVGTSVGVLSLGGMFLGSVIGGFLGERWFTKVSRRALEAEVDIRERMIATNERMAPVVERRSKNGNGSGDGHGRPTRQARQAEDLDELSKEELYQRAQEEDIPGRSHMTKEELKDALQQQH